MQNKEKSKWTEQTKKKQQQERQQNKENMAKQKKEKIEIPWGVEEEEEEEKGEKKEAMEEEEKKKKREKKEEKTKKEEEEEEEEQQQEIELNFGDAIELFNEQKNKKGIKSVEEVDKIDIPLNIFGETATIIPTVDIEWGEDIEVIEVEEEEEEEKEEKKEEELLKTPINENIDMYSPSMKHNKLQAEETKTKKMAEKTKMFSLELENNGQDFSNIDYVEYKEPTTKEKLKEAKKTYEMYVDTFRKMLEDGLVDQQKHIRNDYNAKRLKKKLNIKPREDELPEEYTGKHTNQLPDNIKYKYIEKWKEEEQHKTVSGLFLIIKKMGFAGPQPQNVVMATTNSPKKEDDVEETKKPKLMRASSAGRIKEYEKQIENDDYDKTPLVNMKESHFDMCVSTTFNHHFAENMLAAHRQFSIFPYELAECYRSGMGFKVNHEKAFSYFKSCSKAFHQKHRTTELYLCLYYVVHQVNLMQAILHCRRADQMGDTRGKFFMNKLNQLLRTHDVMVKLRNERRRAKERKRRKKVV